MRVAEKNIFAQPISRVYSFPPLPPNQQLARVQVVVNEPAHIMVPSILNEVETISLQITRPDGTSYFAGEDFIYVSPLSGRYYVDYTADVGELDQIGWYLVQDVTDTKNQFMFYVFPPPFAFFPSSPLAPSGPILITPANGYVAEDDVTFYVAEDDTTFYVQES